MSKYQFTEKETEIHYAEAEAVSRAFWDKEGSLHWGYFENPQDNTLGVDDFLPAAERWNARMLAKSGIDQNARVLDVGVGNGNTAIWLAQQTNCEVVGIDLSGPRIENAKEKAKQYPDLRLSFHKASATQLPFPAASFTHAWSQATLYHVHERKQALQEIYRTLKPKGIFVFDDLLTPVPVSEISAEGDKYVYQRMLFKPLFSATSYAVFLQQLGFSVLEHEDISLHLKKSYELLAKRAVKYYPELMEAYKASMLDPEKYIPPSVSYKKVCDAIDNKDLGWSFFCCKK